MIHQADSMQIARGYLIMIWVGWVRPMACAPDSHSTFNNFCDYSSLANGPNANQITRRIFLLIHQRTYI